MNFDNVTSRYWPAGEVRCVMTAHKVLGPVSVAKQRQRFFTGPGDRSRK